MNFRKDFMQKQKGIGFYRWLDWGILVTIYIIVFFHRLSVGVIIDDLNQSFGMGPIQIANLGAMYFYAYTVMQVPTGVLVDRLGPKKTVVTGCIVAAIGSMVFALSINIPMAYIGRLLVGLGVSVVFLCILKIQANWFPAERFATMSGLTSFVGSMGGLLAQTPLILLVDFIGWRNSFLTMGIVTLILAILAAIFVKNTPTEMGFPPVNPQDTEKVDQEQRESIISQLLKVAKNPKLLFPSIVFGGINGGFLLFTGTFGVSYIIARYNISKTNAANLLSASLLMAGISLIFVGRISDKLKKRKWPMIVISATSVIVWSILIFLQPSIILMIVLVLLIGATSSVGVLCWSMGKEVSNPKLPGMAMSIVNVLGFTFSAILMTLCGKIIDINIAKGLDASAAYSKAFRVVVLSSMISLIFALFTTETRCENIYHE